MLGSSFIIVFWKYFAYFQFTVFRNNGTTLFFKILPIKRELTFLRLFLFLSDLRTGGELWIVWRGVEHEVAGSSPGHGIVFLQKTII